MSEFVSYVRTEVMTRAHNATNDPTRGAIVPVKHSILIKTERKK
jgi:hypothetical protein